MKYIPRDYLEKINEILNLIEVTDFSYAELLIDDLELYDFNKKGAWVFYLRGLICEKENNHSHAIYCYKNAMGIIGKIIDQDFFDFNKPDLFLKFNINKIEWKYFLYGIFLEMEGKTDALEYFRQAVEIAIGYSSPKDKK